MTKLRITFHFSRFTFYISTQIPHKITDFLINLLMFLISSLCLAYEMGFNCGAETVYTAQDGKRYEKDQPYSSVNGAGYVGGRIGKSPAQLKSGGTRDFDLYLQDRRGLSEYRFDVPNGSYIVKLHFSETEHHWRKLRTFDVQIEDAKALADFDIFEKVRRNYVIDYRFATHVTDGQLNVKFVASRGGPVLSAVYVFSRTSDTSPPGEPRSFSAMSGYKQAILDWKDNPENDISGYNVYRSVGGEFRLLEFTPSSSYIDNAVEVHQTYQYYIRPVDVYGNVGKRSEIQSATPLSPSDSELPVYELSTDESHLIYLSQHVWDDVTIPVILRYQGVEYDNVRMRYRGGDARREALKPSIKLIFADSQLFHGKKKLNLQSDTWDSSLMRSKLAFDDYRRAGVLSPEAEWIHLRLNDEFMGVYTAVDQIDERFLSLNGRDATGNIYKPFDFLVVLPDDADYSQLSEKETNKGRADVDLREFVELINLTPQYLIREKLWEKLNLEEYLNWYCTNQLISNWDIAGHNFLLYHDLKQDRWEIIAWDPDAAYVREDMPLDEGTRNHPMYGISNWWDRLIDRVLGVPQFRRMYCLRLLELLDTTFADAERAARVEAGHRRIRFDGERDTQKPGWLENDTWFYPSRDWLGDFVRERNVFLRSAIPDFMPPASVNLFINEIVITEPSEGVDIGTQGWMEIYNWSPKEAVELGGLFLSDDPNQPEKLPLPKVAIPAGGHFVLNSDLLSRDGGFIGLFEPNRMAVDRVVYPAIERGKNYGRVTDGSGSWDFLRTATLGTSNRWDAPVVFARDDVALPLRLVKGVPLTQMLSLQNQIDMPQTIYLRRSLFLPGGERHLIVESQQIQLAPNEHLEYLLTVQLPADLHPGISYEYVIEIGSAHPDAEQKVWDKFAIQFSLFSRAAVQQLYINEVMAANRRTVADERKEFDDWVEIYNAGARAVNLDGMYLSDDMRQPNKWQIRGVEIPPFSYLIFWLDNDEPQGTRHASFSLSASGEGIGIFDTADHDNAIIDWVGFGLQTEDVSFGRLPDGTDNLECFVRPTPGEPNISFGRLNLFLNELMINNASTIADEAGEYDPWLELYNAGCHVINLEGLYLSDNATQPTRWRFPAIEVPPDGYVLVWIDGDVDQGNLHTNFTLNPDGGTLILFDTDANDNLRLDGFNFEVQKTDVSLGRYPNGLGVWEILPTPTPGRKNRPPKLYINEIMARNRSTIADEAGEYDDWIELYNSASHPILLDGMFLSDELGDSTKWRLPATTIPAHGFLLIWADGDAVSAEIELLYIGELHANFSLNAETETVALFESRENGNALIDAIEFAAMEADISYGRNPDGGVELEMFKTPTPGASNISNSETRSGPISLLQNYPNPHAAETIIPYKLSESADVFLGIYDFRGRLVRQFELGFQEAGTYVNPERAVRWDGRNELGERVASGVYFYTMQSGRHQVIRKLIVVR